MTEEKYTTELDLERRRRITRKMFFPIQGVHESNEEYQTRLEQYEKRIEEELQNGRNKIKRI